jgi:hypothetical protein
MSPNDRTLKELLWNARLDDSHDAATRQRVRAAVVATAAGHGSSRSLYGLRGIGVAAGLLLLVSAAGVAATERGRAWLRSWLVPIGETYVTAVPLAADEAWSRTRTDRPDTTDERVQIASDFAAMRRLRDSGAGRLVGLIESPGFRGHAPETTYLVEYTLGDERTSVVGANMLAPAQAKNMQSAALLALRAEGAGEVLEHRPTPIGLGTYIVRFQLEDGTAVDLRLNYPPMTAAELDAIFAEMRAHYAARRFRVLDPSRSGDMDIVAATLVYELADGTTAGAVQQVPPDLISEDGQHVISPLDDTETAIP